MCRHSVASTSRRWAAEAHGWRSRIAVVDHDVCPLDWAHLTHVQLLARNVPGAVPACAASAEPIQVWSLATLLARARTVHSGHSSTLIRTTLEHLSLSRTYRGASLEELP